MPVAQSSALVLRARHANRNLIIQTNGIDARDAGNTATEAVKALQTATALADPGDIAQSVQGMPLSCGCLTLSHGRWNVLYRVVGHMLLLLIVPSSTNTLSALDFLERAVRVITLDFRSIETTPEKLWKRYPEIHLSLGILFQANGCYTARRSIVEANMALEAMAPKKGGKDGETQGEAERAAQEKAAAIERKAAEKKAAADKKAAEKAEKAKKAGNKVVGPEAPAGAEQGAAAAAAAAPSNPQMDREGRMVAGRRRKKRTLADVTGPTLPGVQQPINTEEPLRTLRPLPGFDIGPRVMRGPGFDSQMAALELEARKKAESASLGDMLDDLLGEQKKKDDKKKKDDPFGFVKEELSPLPPPPPPAPPVPSAPLLRLQETWRAKIEGSMVTHVGMGGSVAWVPERVDVQPQVPVVGFGLHLPPTEEQQQLLDQWHQQAQEARAQLAKETEKKGMQEQQAAMAALEQQLAQQQQQQQQQLVESVARQAVKHALQGVWIHPGEVKPGWPPSVHISDAGFTADLANARQLLWPPLLKYTLPAMRSPVPQPVQLAVGGSLEAIGEEGHQTGALVGLSLQLAPELSGGLQPAEIEVKLSYAPLYELPLKVTPPGATLDGSRHQLCWKLQSSNSEGSHMIACLAKGPIAFSAAFVVPAGFTASQGALRQVLAEVIVHGKQGTSLTGTTLLQHGFHGKEEGEQACSWMASASGRPRIPTLLSMRT